MNQHPFEALTRILTSLPSRRDILQGLAGAGLGTGVARLAVLDADARKKHKKKRRKKRKPEAPEPNEFGCLDVGQACNGDSSACCSAIREGTKPKKGKPDKSRCVAHDAGICKAETDICTTGMNVFCNANNRACGCVLTTGNAGFCGDFSDHSGDQLCRNCSTDSDCHEEFGPDAACVVFGGACEPYCPQTGRTACVPACKDSLG